MSGFTISSNAKINIFRNVFFTLLVYSAPGVTPFRNNNLIFSSLILGCQEFCIQSKVCTYLRQGFYLFIVSHIGYIVAVALHVCILFLPCA